MPRLSGIRNRSTGIRLKVFLSLDTNVYCPLCARPLWRACRLALVFDKRRKILDDHLPPAFIVLIEYKSTLSSPVDHEKKGPRQGSILPSLTSRLGITWFFQHAGVVQVCISKSSLCSTFLIIGAPCDSKRRVKVIRQQ
jgi:hypothetical protein